MELDVLHVRIAVPYAVSIVLSLPLWFFLRRHPDFPAQAVCFYQTSGKDFLRKAALAVLILGGAVFVCTGVYMLTLEQYLLGGWALLSCGLALGLAWNIHKHPAAERRKK